ncbi:hypothetical protein ACFSTC_05545 [Nonomuraea ferruginea]
MVRLSENAYATGEWPFFGSGEKRPGSFTNPSGEGPFGGSGPPPPPNALPMGANWAPPPGATRVAAPPPRPQHPDAARAGPGRRPGRVRARQRRHLPADPPERQHRPLLQPRPHPHGQRRPRPPPPSPAWPRGCCPAWSRWRSATAATPRAPPAPGS